MDSSITEMEIYAGDPLQLDSEQCGQVLGCSKATMDSILPTPHRQSHGGDFHRPTYGFGHGHETAVQRYNANRVQAGFEPER